MKTLKIYNTTTGETLTIEATHGTLADAQEAIGGERLVFVHDNAILNDATELKTLAGKTIQTLPNPTGGFS